MAKLPKKVRWPKGLKRRLNAQTKRDARLRENQAIKKQIEAARKKVNKY